jgi:hypothetical protein
MSPVRTGNVDPKMLPRREFDRLGESGVKASTVEDQVLLSSARG